MYSVVQVGRSLPHGYSPPLPSFLSLTSAAVVCGLPAPLPWSGPKHCQVSARPFPSAVECEAAWAGAQGVIGGVSRETCLLCMALAWRANERTNECTNERPRARERETSLQQTGQNRTGQERDRQTDRQACLSQPLRESWLPRCVVPRALFTPHVSRSSAARLARADAFI